MKKLNKEILEIIEEEVKEVVKRVIESLALKERQIYLEEHPSDRGNGYYTRGLITKFGAIENLRVPRVREGDFRPKVLPERRRVSLDLGEVILSLFASGASFRDVSRFMETVYGAYYSPASISRLTEVTTQEIEAWRMRPLAEEYFAIYLDALFLPIRRGFVAKEPVYVALGLHKDGMREVLGFWLFGSEGESATNWQEILGELKERGVKRVELFIADGLKGLREAVIREFAGSKFQRCVLHAVRGSLNKARRRDREALAEVLKRIYRASNKEEAREALLELKEVWGRKYPGVVRKWEENFQDLVTFMDYPEEIRGYIYTTNQLERLMKEIRRRSKVIEVFSGPQSVYKVVYLVLADMNDRYRGRRLRGFGKLWKGDEGLAPPDTLD